MTHISESCDGCIYVYSHKCVCYRQIECIDIYRHVYSRPNMPLTDLRELRSQFSGALAELASLRQELVDKDTHIGMGVIL